MKTFIRILAFVLLCFIATLVIMNLLKSLNKGNASYNIMALTGLFFVFYLVAKTKLFTKFNFKTKTNQKENEKNS